MELQSYAIAIGSNRRGRYGTPSDQVRAALAAVGGVVAASRIVMTAPVGPSSRRFANMAAIIETSLTPPQLLDRVKQVERDFGRRRGRRWGSRVIDLDIILWRGGSWSDRALIVPHPAFRGRRFVLDPLAAIAPAWRDPITGLSVRQLHYRLRARLTVGASAPNGVQRKVRGAGP